MSVQATLKRLLSRPDAERICRKLIEQAKAGDLQAVKLLLDRMDGPLSGPLAVAIAESSVNVVQAVEGTKVEVVVPDNYREMPKEKLREIVATLGLSLATAALPVPPVATPPVLEQPPEPPALRAWQTGEEFLKS